MLDVIVSYIGDQGGDLSGEDYKHGEMVEKGFKVITVREEQINLEDAFMKITKGQVA